MCLLPRLHFLDSILRIRIPKTGSGNAAQTSQEFEILPEPLESWEVWASHMLSLRILSPIYSYGNCRQVEKHTQQQSWDPNKSVFL